MHTVVVIEMGLALLGAILLIARVADGFASAATRSARNCGSRRIKTNGRWKLIDHGLLTAAAGSTFAFLHDSLAGNPPLDQRPTQPNGQ